MLNLRTAPRRVTPMTIPFDTSPEAAEIQEEVIRRMSGADRLMLALEMSVAARELRAAGIREEHPDWPEEEVRRELLRHAFDFKNLPPPLR